MAKKKEFVYDVFISYSHQNQDWAKHILLARLEQAGLKVFIDYRDFEIGESAPDAMEHAVTTSKQTIIVLSPAYLKSNWAKFENLMLQIMDPANQKRQLIPILLENCKIPLRLSTFTYADFTKIEGIDLAWEKLFKALKVSSPAPMTPIAAPSVPHDPSHWHLAHPYPMPPNFTGRATELKMLDDWPCDDTNRLFILRALGGFGKSALAWQWINMHINPTEWTKVLWWSFYEGDASFEHFIEETLKYLKLEVPQGQRPQVDELLKAMQSQKILLIMDGFERALRAYSSMNAAYQGDELKIEDNQLDCVNINAEIFLKSVCSLPNIKSKVLMTTRLSPRAVKPRGESMLGCREVELTSMQPADAVEFFHKQKIKGTHAEIESACAPYGYHPLSLRLLAGRILKDFENPADISVAQKLKIDADVIQQKHHVLEVSYNSLPPHEQKLLSTIACFRSPVELNTLQSIAENKDTLDKDLHDLVERGLLHFDDKNKKFDLHPIVRRYAYKRLTGPDRVAAHTCLSNYFAAIEAPKQVKALDDLTPVIELYHHMIRAGLLDDAANLYYHRLWKKIYYQLGAYQMQIELLQGLFLDENSMLPSVTREDTKAWILSELSNAYSLNGQPQHSIPLVENHNRLQERAGEEENVAIGLGNLADEQRKTGNLQSAEINLLLSLEIGNKHENNYLQAVQHLELGHLLVYCGMWEKSELGLSSAFEMFEKASHDLEGIGQVWLYRALHHLRMTRNSMQSKIENGKPAIEFAQQSLNLVKEDAREDYPVERDFVRAYWLLGAAYHLDGQQELAESHLSEALIRDRRINLVELEADIILDLARLRYDQKNYEEAKSFADEALTIAERCGYVLQGADVNLFLAQYALKQEKDKAKAKQYAEEAKKLATCDGPPYYYKVAYEEAERMLEKLSPPSRPSPKSNPAKKRRGRRTDLGEGECSVFIIISIDVLPHL